MTRTTAGRLPRVLVTSDQIAIEGYRMSAAPDAYVNALWKGAGALPVQLPATASGVPLEAYLAGADGVLVTGARSNVHPSCYGAVESEEHPPFDPVRDAITLRLIRMALDRAIPLLAICRGFQELNVALGGTLHPAVHTRPGALDHRFPDDPDVDVRFRIAHPVAVTVGGRLEDILGAQEIRVNSLHRQGVDRLAEGLTVEAVAPDGLIEAARVAGAPAFALGVQWHPEYWVETDQPSADLFAAFGEAVRARAFAEGPAGQVDLVP